MDRLLSTIKWLLVGWGALSLVFCFWTALTFSSKLSRVSHSSTDQLSAQDVRYVLNWCKLGDDRIEKVEHSFESGRSFTGDHVDISAIKINKVSVEELTKPVEKGELRWYRGDQMPDLVEQAVTQAGDLASNHAPWFPSNTELHSAQIYVYPWEIECYGIRPHAAALIFVRPKDRMIFFVDYKL